MSYKPGAFLALAVALYGCKPAASSKLKDAATTTSFKTGAFVPRTPSEFEVSEAVQPIATKEFVDRARKLAKNPDLKLADVEGLVYTVVANGSGNNYLLLPQRKMSRHHKFQSREINCMHGIN